MTLNQVVYSNTTLSGNLTHPLVNIFHHFLLFSFAIWEFLLSVFCEESGAVMSPCNMSFLLKTETNKDIFNLTL